MCAGVCVLVWVVCMCVFELAIVTVRVRVYVCCMCVYMCVGVRQSIVNVMFVVI